MEIVDNRIIKNIFNDLEKESIVKSYSEVLLNRKHINWNRLKDKNENKNNYTDSTVVKIDKDMGRKFANDIVFEKNIIDSVLNIAKKINSSAKYLTSTYCSYSSEYGYPNLSYHNDRGDNLLCLDYQLSSNTIWELGIEDKLYTINDNEIVYFYTKSELHGRPNKIFNQKEHIDVIFFYFKVDN